jgi:hypothetical protein
MRKTEVQATIAAGMAEIRAKLLCLVNPTRQAAMTEAEAIIAASAYGQLPRYAAESLRRYAQTQTEFMPNDVKI